MVAGCAGAIALKLHVLHVLHGENLAIESKAFHHKVTKAQRNQKKFTTKGTKNHEGNQVLLNQRLEPQRHKDAKESKVFHHEGNQ